MPTTARRRPVCLIVHSYYEEDARVRRQAETLVRSGRPVDVYALRRPGEAEFAELDGVRLRRLPVQRHQGAGIGRYLLEYLDFFVRAAVAVTLAHARRRYALVQVATIPDFLVFAGLPLRLAAGVPLLIDLHEAMPEFFRVRFPARFAGPAHALLVAQERASIAVASAAITVNDALVDRLVGLGVARSKLHVVLNAPDLLRFDPAAAPDRPFMADGTLRLVYAGALTPIYEVDVAIEAVARLRALRPELPVRFEIFGRGDSEPRLAALAAERGLADAVVLRGRIPLEEVPAAIAAADVGLAPTRRDPMTDVSLSTKVFEYAAMGKSVVASGLPTVRRYFPDETLSLYEPGDPDDLARRLLELVDEPAGRGRRLAATAARVADLSWDVQGAAYVGLVERFARDGLSSAR